MKKTKCTVAVLAIVVIMLIAGIGTSIYFALMSYKQMQDVSQYITELQAEPKEEETRENDVKIAGSYEIKSTEAISDAYKSKDTSKLSDKERETLDMASDILEEIITDGMTDIEKETAVYDWMCANLGHDSNLLLVIPEGDGDADNPYGVLKYHNAVCVGYATTFRMFMQMMDIECMVVHNTECYHSWDLVNLDGNWYHTDIYADAGSGNYTNFNVPDVMRMREQNWDMDFFPHATSFKYYKAMENLETADSISDIPALIAKYMGETYSNFFIKFNGTVDEEFARRAVAVVTMYSSAIEGLQLGDIRYSGAYGTWVSDPDNGGFIFLVSINGETDGTSYQEDLTDDERAAFQQKIDELMNSLAEKFGGSYSGGSYYYEDNTETDYYDGIEGDI